MGLTTLWNLPVDSETEDKHWGWVMPTTDDELASWVAARAATDARPCCRRRLRPSPLLPSSAAVPSTWSSLDNDDDDASWLPGTRPPPTRQQNISAVRRNITDNQNYVYIVWPVTRNHHGSRYCPYVTDVTSKNRASWQNTAINSPESQTV